MTSRPVSPSGFRSPTSAQEAESVLQPGSRDVQAAGPVSASPLPKAGDKRPRRSGSPGGNPPEAIRFQPKHPDYDIASSDDSPWQPFFGSPTPEPQASPMGAGGHQPSTTSEDPVTERMSTSSRGATPADAFDMAAERLMTPRFEPPPFALTPSREQSPIATPAPQNVEPAWPAAPEHAGGIAPDDFPATTNRKKIEDIWNQRSAADQAAFLVRYANADIDCAPEAGDEAIRTAISDFLDSLYAHKSTTNPRANRYNEKFQGAAKALYGNLPRGAHAKPTHRHTIASVVLGTRPQSIENALKAEDVARRAAEFRSTRQGAGPHA